MHVVSVRVLSAGSMAAMRIGTHRASVDKETATPFEGGRWMNAVRLTGP
jgi:hypothetical protein